MIGIGDVQSTLHDVINSFLQKIAAYINGPTVLGGVVFRNAASASDIRRRRDERTRIHYPTCASWTEGCLGHGTFSWLYRGLGTGIY